MRLLLQETSARGWKVGDDCFLVAGLAGCGSVGGGLRIWCSAHATHSTSFAGSRRFRAGEEATSRSMLQTAGANLVQLNAQGVFLPRRRRTFKGVRDLLPKSEATSV